LSKPKPPHTSRAAEPPSGAEPRDEVRYLRIGAEHQGQRIDNFLLTRLKGAPRALIYRILRSGEVRLNRGRAKPSTRLEIGDSVRLPPLRLSAVNAAASPSTGLQERLKTAILYEDERLLVIDKPSGLAVHGGSGLSLGLIEALRAMRPQQSLELIHRLDRDTSGCLLISKKPVILRWLHQQLREGRVGKGYLALLTGQLVRERLKVDAPLHKNQLRGGERVVRVDYQQGKAARSEFQVRDCLAGCTLAEIRLDTGRTHQIRVHAAHLGAPVAGDAKYGDAAANRWLGSLGLNRLFLHAMELHFRPHPDAKPLHVTAPLPSELHQVLEKLAIQEPRNLDH
jgi:23S rRNA pseudouridine955/2504/2580 synthase